MAAWKVVKLSRNVVDIKIPVIRNKSWEFWALLSSDRHWDHPDSDRKLQEKHLKEAVEKNAVVIDCGDFYCAMQGKYDPRASKSAIRPEHQVDDYLDALVRTGAEWFKPYAKNFAVIGAGNHESNILKRFEVNLIERLVTLLNTNGGEVINGGFSGWVRFRFTEGKGHERNSVVLHYDHGYGGGGPVTKDIIQHQRRAVYLPDADIVISGHVHEAFVAEFCRARITTQGNLYQDVQTHIKLPTYKDDYKDGYRGWHPESGKGPKPLGAWWLRFYHDAVRQGVLYEVIRAK